MENIGRFGAPPNDPAHRSFGRAPRWGALDDAPTLPEGFPALRGQRRASRQGEPQLAAFRMGGARTSARPMGRPRDLPPYTGPVTGEQLAIVDVPAGWSAPGARSDKRTPAHATSLVRRLIARHGTRFTQFGVIRALALMIERKPDDRTTFPEGFPAVKDLTVRRTGGLRQDYLPERQRLDLRRAPAAERATLYAGPKTGDLLSARRVAVTVGEPTLSSPRHHFSASRVPWILVAVFVVQGLLSLRLVWSNTAFTDEALYLWAGHLELAHWLHGTPVPAFQTYFSGAPVIYPPLGAIADAFGGLATARLLSMAFMLGATGLLYGTATRVAGRTAGACSALVFALLGPVQFLGAFATYDAMALFLLALAAWLVVRGSGPASELYLIGGGLVLALADATKYAASLWDPVVIVLAGLAAANCGMLRRSLRGARMAVYAAVPVSVALLRYGGPSYIKGIMSTTVDRQVGSASASAGLVLRDSFNWLWFLLILAVIGSGLAFAGDGRLRAVLTTCTGAVLLAPLHQAQIHTTVSLHKHVAFGAWFGAIAAGYALSRAMDTAGRKGWRLAAAAGAIMAFVGVPQATQMFADGWPNMASAEAIVARSVATTGCPCMVTADTVTYYYLLRTVYPGDLGEFTGPYFFYYWDTAKRRELSGTPAYLQAIRDHYFALIEIDPGETFAPAAAVLKVISETPGYEQVAAIHVQDLEHDDAHGIVRIWRYDPAPAGGPSRRVGHI
jgi:hypothetical protein